MGGRALRRATEIEKRMCRLMGKKMKDLVNEIPNEEIELFGEHKTREQIKAEQQDRRAQQRQALREQRAARRQAMRDLPAPQRHERLVLILVVGGILALCVALMVIQFSHAEENAGWELDTTLESHFIDEDAEPELSDEGITAALAELYYTKNGHLCVRLVLGNGTADAMRLDSLDVSLYNGDDAFIGGGYLAVTDAAVTVPAGGTCPYTMYIAPQHLTLHDDSLMSIRYSSDAAGTLLNATE